MKQYESQEIGGSLATPRKVQKLQEALHAKAKGSPGYRFYALYDKMYREDIVEFAYRRNRRNGGVAGVDGQKFEDIEEYGVEKWLGEVAEELREKRYRPEPVRRVYIAKPDGGQRGLGIPTIKDRVVQMAAVLVLGPIFEADLQPEQHAYRPGRSALDAVRQVHTQINNGHTEVIEADLTSYFETIPHRELLQSVIRRVSDRHMIRLIKMWLEAPVEEIDDRGRHHRTTGSKDEHRGIPQGAPISPLLSNLYMRRFILGWKVLGHQHRLRAEIVNYADDFVILCRGTSERAMEEMREMMRRLKLTVNEAKTRICRLPGEKFEFLSYEFGRCYSHQTGRMYLGTRPSHKEVQRLCRKISEATSRRRTLLDAGTMVKEINHQLVGWSNYFCLGPVSKAYAAVDRHACRRLRQWLRAKHKVRGQGTSRFPDKYLYEELGLTRLCVRTRRFPWATA